MTIRSTISRREPVIALESFRYKGRNYKEGGYLDRRRCRMPHSKLVRLIREGVVTLAKNVDPEKLAEYGFTYNPENPRIKLNRISRLGHEVRQDLFRKRNDLAMKKHFKDEAGEEELEPLLAPEVISDIEEAMEKAEIMEDDESPEPTLKHVGGGWYDVMLEGKQINDAGLRKDDAETLISNYKAGV